MLFSIFKQGVQIVFTKIALQEINELTIIFAIFARYFFHKFLTVCHSKLKHVNTNVKINCTFMAVSKC